MDEPLSDDVIELLLRLGRASQEKILANIENGEDPPYIEVHEIVDIGGGFTSKFTLRVEPD